MITGLERLKSHRMWFVPDIAVWGLAIWEQIEFAVLERIGSDTALLFGRVDLDDNAQQLLYVDLVDHRGNHLPDTIDTPLVMIRSRGEQRSYVVGRESNQGVKVARTAASPAAVTSDLLVIEMGS
ncbi:MAG TPA: hypothetical protein PLF13_01895 [candidate division Zixibacteria bacterium]|nr:hypothetical protein [candidate division Zixibacteria bacterium]